MSLVITRIPNEPIIVSTVTGLINVDVIKELFAETEKLADAENMGSPVWRVTDLTDVQSTFSEVVILLAEAAKNPDLPGSPLNPRYRAVLVGTDALVKLYVEASKQAQYGGRQIVIYASLNEALAHARQEIAEYRITQAA